MWIARLQAGLLGGAMAVTFSISHASLVTNTALPAFLPVAVAMALTGTLVLNLVLGWLSKARGIVPIVQDIPSAAMGAIIGAIAAQSGDASLGLPSFVVLLSGTTLLFALSFYLFGRFRLGALVRFTPRPLIAGFLAGTGWFLIAGGIGLSLGYQLTIARMPDMLDGASPVKLLTAAGVASMLWLGGRFLPRNMVFGSSILVGVVGVHLVAWLLGVPYDKLLSQGWFMTLPADTALWPPIPPARLAEADISILVDNAFPILALIVLATIAQLMNSSALELERRIDLPVDHELKSLGLANFASSVVGGLPGYYGVSPTLAAQKIAPPHFSVSWVAAGTVASVLVFGNQLLAILPLPVLAGFMLWVGISMVLEWLIDGIGVVPVKEAVLTSIIFGVIVSLGLFEGAVFGLFAGAILFVVDYSRLNPIRAQVFGDVYHGSSELSPQRLAVLQAHGRSIAIIKVQGFVFFGTAHRLKQSVADLCRDTPEIRFVVLDFAGTSGLDSTALMSFHRIGTDLAQRGVLALLTGQSEQVRLTFLQSGIGGDDDPIFRMGGDLETALLELERGIFERHAPELLQDGPRSLDAMLAELFQDETLAEALRPYLERLDFAAGQVLFRKGDPSDDLYFLEAGRLDVIAGPDGAENNLRRLEPGAVIGELAFYSASGRTASIRAADAAVVWRLSGAATRRILDENPTLAAAFHKAMAEMLTTRVQANTRLIETLWV